MTIMQLIIDKGSAVFESRFELEDFPDLVRAHLKNVPSTAECEQFGKVILKSEFKFDSLKKFIRDVCHWGGRTGISGIVFKNNQPVDIIKRFEAARNCMTLEEPDLEEALQEINKIKGLNTPSFASKHLRMLWPHFCPILDSYTRKLGYDFTPEGYVKFAEDCEVIAQALMDRKIENPIHRPSDKWFISEIDMALFAQLRGWKT